METNLRWHPPDTSRNEIITIFNSQYDIILLFKKIFLDCVICWLLQ